MRFREIWWVIAHQADGKMAYFKAECGSEEEANNKVKELLKSEPQYRYQLLQIQ